jgi:hypothetical protein
MSKIREEELIMLLKVFINDIWDRAKNLRPSNVIYEKREMGKIARSIFQELTMVKWSTPRQAAEWSGESEQRICQCLRFIPGIQFVRIFEPQAAHAGLCFKIKHDISHLY